MLGDSKRWHYDEQREQSIFPQSVFLDAEIHR
jgi:hypothetical protein